MSEIKDGGPAFPCDEQIRDSMIYQPEPGMTVRDYFAAKAMPVLLTELFAGWRGNESPCVPEWMDGISVDAYRVADAMLRARGAE